MGCPGVECEVMARDKVKQTELRAQGPQMLASDTCTCFSKLRTVTGEYKPYLLFCMYMWNGCEHVGMCIGTWMHVGGHAHVCACGGQRLMSNVFLDLATFLLKQTLTFHSRPC